MPRCDSRERWGNYSAAPDPVLRPITAPQHPSGRTDSCMLRQLRCRTDVMRRCGQLVNQSAGRPPVIGWLERRLASCAVSDDACLLLETRCLQRRTAVGLLAGSSALASCASYSPVEYSSRFGAMSLERRCVRGGTVWKARQHKWHASQRAALSSALSCGLGALSGLRLYLRELLPAAASRIDRAAARQAGFIRRPRCFTGRFVLAALDEKSRRLAGQSLTRQGDQAK